MLQELTVPKHGETQTHDVIQYLKGKHNPIQKCVEVWGDIQCDSCDMILAKEGQTIKLGHKCWNCYTPVIFFLPVESKNTRQFTVEPEDEFTDEENDLIIKLAAYLLEVDPDNKVIIHIEAMDWLQEQRTNYGVQGHLRVIVNTYVKANRTPEEHRADFDMWVDFFRRTFPGRDPRETMCLGFHVAVITQMETPHQPKE